jgi:hypothetical protein
MVSISKAISEALLSGLPKAGENRRSGHSVKDRERVTPSNARELLTTGGVRGLEWRAAFHAAKAAVLEERSSWLPVLEGWAAETDDAFTLGLLDREIKRLRRALGIRQSDGEHRAKTRERVRKHRAKHLDRSAVVAEVLARFVEKKRNDVNAWAIAEHIDDPRFKPRIVAKALDVLRSSGEYERIVSGADRRAAE